MTLSTYSRWEDVPDGLKTRTQLGQMGLKPGKEQQPAAIKTHWNYKIPDYDLYDVSLAIPKKPLSEAQKQAIEKAQAASLAARTCRGCGIVEELGQHYRHKLYIRNGYCPRCRERKEHLQDIEDAITWATEILAMPADKVFVMDTETTGLDGEIIDLAITDLSGNVLFNSHFKPLTEIEPGATAIHGLTVDSLRDAPLWTETYPQLVTLLHSADLILIYNASFDTARISYTCQLHGVDDIEFKYDCLMLWYAQYVNDWSSYWKSYRWQPLYGGDHTALGDCKAALETLRRMATQ